MYVTLFLEIGAEFPLLFSDLLEARRQLDKVWELYMLVFTLHFLNYLLTTQHRAPTFLIVATTFTTRY